MGTAFAALVSSDSVWLDVIGLAAAVTLLEAAVTGRGRTHGRGRVSYWRVALWLRPVLGIVGFGLLGVVVVHFLRSFYLVHPR